jgi:hypothetical protein
MERGRKKGRVIERQIGRERKKGERERREREEKKERRVRANRETDAPVLKRINIYREKDRENEIYRERKRAYPCPFSNVSSSVHTRGPLGSTMCPCQHHHTTVLYSG